MRNVCIGLLFAGLAAAQDGTRGIVPEEVIAARPQKMAGAVVSKPKYQALKTGAAQTGAAQTGAMARLTPGRQIGVTIWRLRPGSSDDTGARILVQEDNQTRTWVPERVSSGGSLRTGERVRLTIEAPEAGYLYVIDRERYASGEGGTPYLIFPTSRTRSGDNRLSAGKLIDIPAQDDRPNYFTLQASRTDQAEEDLTVLLTPVPLPGIEPGAKPLALSAEQVAGWEKQWGSSKFDVFELAGGEGKRWTQAEQQAAGGTRVLTQEDPAPQTVYRVAAQAGDPLLVRVRLRYQKGK